MDFSPKAAAAPRSEDPLAVFLPQRAPLVLIESHEEHAVIERLQALLKAFLSTLCGWSITRGLHRLDLVEQLEKSPEFAPSSNQVLDLMQRAFAIHLARRKLAVSEFDLDALATHSAGVSGAEIEQAIAFARFSAQAANAAASTDIVVDELKKRGRFQ